MRFLKLFVFLFATVTSFVALADDDFNPQVVFRCDALFKPNGCTDSTNGSARSMQEAMTSDMGLNMPSAATTLPALPERPQVKPFQGPSSNNSLSPIADGGVESPAHTQADAPKQGSSYGSGFDQATQQNGSFEIQQPGYGQNIQFNQSHSTNSLEAGPSDYRHSLNSGGSESQNSEALGRIHDQGIDQNHPTGHETAFKGPGQVEGANQFGITPGESDGSQAIVGAQNSKVKTYPNFEKYMGFEGSEKNSEDQGFLGRLASKMSQFFSPKAPTDNFGGKFAAGVEHIPKYLPNGQPNPKHPDFEKIFKSGYLKHQRNLASGLEFGAANVSIFNNICEHYQAYAIENKIPDPVRHCQIAE